VLDVMQADNLLDNVNRVGEWLLTELKNIDGIKEVRGQGLMIGIEFDEPVKDIRRKLLFEERVFTGVSGTNTIRLLPPLSLTMEQAELFIDKFRKTLKGES
jgi:acetylornithine aminotransferase